MNDKKQLARKHTLKALKIMLIMSLVSFLAGPFLFWSEISQFNSIGLTVFIPLHIIIHGSLFAFFLYRYKIVSTTPDP